MLCIQLTQPETLFWPWAMTRLRSLEMPYLLHFEELKAPDAEYIA
jgi:hypothetical protein